MKNDLAMAAAEGGNFTGDWSAKGTGQGPLWESSSIWEYRVLLKNLL